MASKRFIKKISENDKHVNSTGFNSEVPGQTQLPLPWESPPPSQRNKSLSRKYGTRPVGMKAFHIWTVFC